MFSNLKKTMLNLFIIFSMTIALLEAALQIYNPIPIRVIAGEFRLIPNGKGTIENVVGVREGLLPKLAVKKHNEIGFLGDNLEHFRSADIRIITIGGSTTECYYLGDGKTWPAQMKTHLETLLPGQSVSLINAGLDGHSTFGHIALLQHFKGIFEQLRPTHILIMAGINDFGLWDQKPRSYDLRNLEVSLLKKSILFNLISAYINADEKWAFRNDHERVLKWQEHELFSKKEFVQRLRDYEEGQKQDIEKNIKQEDGYFSRLKEISNLIISIGASPVLIEQVAAYGDYTDPSTGTDMAALKLGDWSGLTRALALEQYNAAMAEVAASNEITFIPLGDFLPNDTKYFYDEVHLGLEGARQVGVIVARNISDSLKHQF